MKLLSDGCGSCQRPRYLYCWPFPHAAKVSAIPLLGSLLRSSGPPPSFPLPCIPFADFSAHPSELCHLFSTQTNSLSVSLAHLLQVGKALCAVIGFPPLWGQCTAHCCAQHVFLHFTETLRHPQPTHFDPSCSSALPESQVLICLYSPHTRLSHGERSPLGSQGLNQCEAIFAYAVFWFLPNTAPVLFVALPRIPVPLAGIQTPSFNLIQIDTL